jgi:hypothetical protein
MTLWKVEKCCKKNDRIEYYMLPYDLKGVIKNCFKYYGIKGLKDMHLSRRRAAKIVDKRNKEV